MPQALSQNYTRIALVMFITTLCISLFGYVYLQVNTQQTRIPKLNPKYTVEVSSNITKQNTIPHTTRPKPSLLFSSAYAQNDQPGNAFSTHYIYEHHASLIHRNRASPKRKKKKNASLSPVLAPPKTLLHPEVTQLISGTIYESTIIHDAIFLNGNPNAIIAKNKDNTWQRWTIPLGKTQQPFSVGIAQDWVAIGDPSDQKCGRKGGCNNHGQVKLFSKTDQGQWQLTTTLKPKEKQLRFLNFGQAVTFANNTLVVAQQYHGPCVSKLDIHTQITCTIQRRVLSPSPARTHTPYIEALHIYERHQKKWSHQQTIPLAQRTILPKTMVSTEQWLAVTSIVVNPNDAQQRSEVLLFQRKPDNTWHHHTTIKHQPDNSKHTFGSALKWFGNTLLIVQAKTPIAQHNVSLFKRASTTYTLDLDPKTQQWVVTAQTKEPSPKTRAIHDAIQRKGGTRVE